MALPITTGKQDTPQRVGIYGPEGIGKTLLAAQFPRPIFIDTEGSTERYDVTRGPKPTSFAGLMRIMAMLRQDTQGFQTAVLDTADWAERLCAADLLAKKSLEGLEDMGYGKGYQYLAEDFAKLLDAMNDLRSVGMHVVITAHAQTRKFELADEFGQYDRWELKLQKKTAPLLKEWADMLLFMNYETFVVMDEKTKSRKAQGGQRVIHTVHHPCWDAKNRHDLPEVIRCESPQHAYSQIAHCFGAVAPKPESAPVDSVTAPLDVETHIPAHLVKLLELMRQDGITATQVQDAIAKRGYFPAGTPLENLPEDFVLGRLVAGWAKVVELIKQGEKANV